jgi:LPXTG-site transpeptidase (sortase) family protein
MDESVAAVPDRRVPTVIKIKSINLELPVIGTKIVDGKWETSGEGVSYLSSSPVPGEYGNSVMYGHNWPNIFGRLNKVKTDDVITILYSDGSARDFVVKDVFTVNPRQTHILSPTQDSRLTIYTCTGWFDLKRFVVTAVPV